MKCKNIIVMPDTGFLSGSNYLFHLFPWRGIQFTTNTTRLCHNLSTSVIIRSNRPLTRKCLKDVSYTQTSVRTATKLPKCFVSRETEVDVNTVQDLSCVRFRWPQALLKKAVYSWWRIQQTTVSCHPSSWCPSRYSNVPLYFEITSVKYNTVINIWVFRTQLHRLNRHWPRETEKKEL